MDHMVDEDAADIEDVEQELDEAEADDGATILGLVDGQTGREETKVGPSPSSPSSPSCSISFFFSICLCFS